MKRFFSLMLVALLLVSAIPFQAFADGHSHSWKEIKNVPATCEADGSVTHECQNKEGCTYASNNYQRITTIPKLSHSGLPYEVVKEPTCSAKGSEVQKCVHCGDVIDEREIAIDATKHQRDNGTVTTDAKCGENGVKEYKCVLCGESMGTEAVAALEHVWNAGVVTEEPTCVEPGVKTFTCTRDCGETKTEPVAATGVHTYEDGECEECGAAQDANDTNSNFALKFNYKNANGNWTSSMVAIKIGNKINAPEIPSVSGLKHTGWDNDLEDGYTRWYAGMPTEYTATYVESTDDGLVDLTVYAYYYVDGEYHHKAKLFVEEFEESRTGNMVPWIYDEGVSAVTAALAAEHGANGYQWNPVKFYNCFTDGEVSEWGDLKTDGNKSIYVKIDSKKAIEATILLHIHTKQEYAIARTIKMAGYTAGDFVSYNEALAKVKNYYTGSKLSMSDLYSESDWEDLMDGLKSSGSKTVKVEDNDTTEIHVILKNATSKTSSNADPSNPKTGDYIMIAVGTMAMAAAALVTLAELKKRKMI